MTLLPFFKRMNLVFLLILFICSCSNEATSQYVPVNRFDPKRDAAKDIADAVKNAQKSNKRIILDVGGDWCSWCHKLDKFFEDNEDIKEFLGNHFIVVKINYSKENKNEAVLSKYPQIPGYPHLFVLESNGTFLYSQDTGALESGDRHGRDKVFAFLKKWAK